MKAFLQSNNRRIFCLLALAAMMATATLSAYAVSASEVHRVLEQQTRLRGAAALIGAKRSTSPKAER